MTTRTRSQGSQGAYFQQGRKRSRIRVGTTIGEWQPWEMISPIDEGYFFYEEITDVTGSPLAEHDVSHSATQARGGLSPGYLAFQTDWSVGFPQTQWECEVAVPVRLRMIEHKGHLGTLAGLKALAIARVPAYSSTDVQGFLSLMEARECANSLAVKSAASLAQLGFMAYKTIRAGRGSRILSREGLDAVKQLLLGGRVPKGAWQALLAGLNLANNANMEWKYGWKPMIQQIKAANDVVSDIARLRQRLLDGVRVYGQAMETRSETISESVGALVPDVELAGVWTLTGSKTTKRIGTASIERRLAPSSAMYDVNWFTSLDVVMELNGLDPSLKGLWQLSKFSFITDWFWNASSLLESLETLKSPVGSSFTSDNGLYSEKTETALHGVLSCEPSSGNKYNAVGQVDYKTYDRHSDPLTGGPAFYIPPITVPTDAGKWWSMAQIAFQTLVRKVR